MITGAFFQTNAPEAYDGFGTQTLGKITEDGARTVFIHAEHQMWQIGRYRSGLYNAVLVDVKIEVRHIDARCAGALP